MCPREENNCDKGESVHSNEPHAHEPYSPEVSTHFSGLSNEDGFFFPMFMRLLSIKPGPYFFFTVDEFMVRLDHLCSACCVSSRHIMRLNHQIHRLCFQKFRRDCRCCCRSLMPRSVSHSARPGRLQRQKLKCGPKGSEKARICAKINKPLYK